MFFFEYVQNIIQSIETDSVQMNRLNIKKTYLLRGE